MSMNAPLPSALLEGQFQYAASIYPPASDRHDPAAVARTLGSHIGIATLQP